MWIWRPSVDLSNIYFHPTPDWGWQKEFCVWCWIHNLKNRVLSPLWTAGVDYLIPPLLVQCNPILTSVKGESIGQFSSFYLFSQFIITATGNQDGSFSAACPWQLKNEVKQWYNFSCVTAWSSHHSKLQSLQIRFKWWLEIMFSSPVSSFQDRAHDVMCHL